MEKFPLPDLPDSEKWLTTRQMFILATLGGILSWALILIAIF